MRIPIYLDASHIVRFGLETPVGVARVEHYVAESLLRDPTLRVEFIVFDAALGGFRTRTDEEARHIDHILFRRFQRPRPRLPAVPERGDGTPAPLPRVAFDRRLTTLAGRLFPISPLHGFARRLATRVMRRLGLAVARGGYATASSCVGLVKAIRHLARPDAPAPAPDGLSLDGVSSGLLATQPAPIRFADGAIVLSMGNGWDYLDYAYLHRICRDDKIRFVTLVYDVIAMQLPYTTPNPSHIYHRHWVEIGHCAAHLLAISAFSAAQYTRYIGEPNDLAPPLTFAHLPDFLHDRAAEIGQVPIDRLLGRRFVLFCSTIETRKNHQLLLQLWDRLRLEFGPNRLPILVFAGKWGWGTDTVRLLGERNFHLRPCLLILNRVDDAQLIWLYRHALVSVFPALSEGYGLGAAESLAFGTPVVISNCPALVEATEGLMPAHDPLDFMAWLQQLRGLIRDDRRLDELRRAAACYRGPDYDEFAGAIRAIVQGLSADTSQRLAAD